METLFTGNMVGSWRFVRSTQPRYNGRTLYHFTGAGLCYWEFDDCGRRAMETVPYKFENGELAFGHENGFYPAREAVQEDDGSVRLTNAKGDVQWWIVRLSAPEPYATAFVNAEGQMETIKTDELPHDGGAIDVR